MGKGQPDLLNHFFLPEDQSLFDYDYIFFASAMWIELGMADVEATFDLYVRHLPENRNFLVFTGLEEIITGILNWHYTKDDIDFLLKRKIITKKFVPFLKKFKFTGDIWGMPEGNIFFPGEPVIRITDKLWKINLLTFFLINSLSSNTIFSSKMARGFLASKGKTYVATCSPVRGHAHEASLKFGRAAYLFGSASGMVPGFARKFDIAYHSKARAFHAFIKSFPTEIEAMRAAAKIFPDCSVMVDTYEVKQGIKNFITVALEQKKKELPTFSAAFIDSGKDVKDFAKRAEYVRKELDKNGLDKIQIIVAGNFQEYRIAELVKLKAPVDKVILGTEFITPADDPRLEVILKMAQFKRDGKIYPTAKLAKGKESYPGVKQVFRKYSENKMSGDIIGLRDEKLGAPLLKKMVIKGKSVYKLPSLDKIAKYLEKELQRMPKNLKRIDKQYFYPVKISSKLQNLFEETKKYHLSNKK